MSRFQDQQMYDDFRGWKRKVGLATLLLACVLAVAWIQSPFLIHTFVCNGDWNSFTFDPNGQQYTSGIQRMITFAPNGIVWRKQVGGGRQATVINFIGFGWWPEFASTAQIPPEGWDSDRDWQASGFQFGKYTLYGTVIGNGPAAGQRVATMVALIWKFPYWSIVIPLTALSAWLLLSRRRLTTNSKPSQEPAI